MVEKLSEKLQRYFFFISGWERELEPQEKELISEAEYLEQYLQHANELADQWLYGDSSGLHRLGLPPSDIVKTYGMILKISLGRENELINKNKKTES